MRLEAIERQLREKGDIGAEVIANRKVLSSGQHVIQLEQSIGSCVSEFENIHCET